MMTAIAILTLIGLAWWGCLLVHYAATEKQRDHDEAIQRAIEVDPYAEMDAAFESYREPAVFRRVSGREPWPWGGNAHQRRVHARFVRRAVDHMAKGAA